jgi:hypothetical protein
MPRSIRAERISLATTFAHRAVADRAKLLDTLRRGEQPVLSHKQFVTSLIDMFLAAITAPVTGEARRAPSPPTLGRKPAVREAGSG